jgi:hypothetical protein
MQYSVRMRKRKYQPVDSMVIYGWYNTIGFRTVRSGFRWEIRRLHIHSIALQTDRAVGKEEREIGREATLVVTGNRTLWYEVRLTIVD